MSQDRSVVSIPTVSPSASPIRATRSLPKFRFALVSDKIVTTGLYFLIVATPLAFGTVEPWSIALAEVLIFAIALAWGLAMVSLHEFRIERTPLNLCWLAALGLGLVQVLPLPLPLIRMLSPKAYALYQEMAFDAGLTSSWRTLSLYPYATQQELIRLFAFALLFWVVANHCKTREQVDRIVRLVIAMGFLLAVFGIVQNVSGTRKLYWIREMRDSNYLFGPYINRNHFAGYIEMVIPLTLGYLLATSRREPNGPSGWRERVLRWGTPEASRSLLIFFVGLIMFAALLQTGSRSGLFSFLGSMFLFAFLLSARRTRSHTRRTLLILFVALGLVSAMWIKPDVVPKTIEAILWVGTSHDPSARGRLLIWSDTLRIGLDYLWTGTGLNTFAWVFPLYYRRPPPDKFFYDFAHNDYLQAFAEGGLPFVTVIAVALALGGTQLVKGWWRSQHRHTQGIGLGLLSGVIALLLHSAGDFNLHLMANAILFVVLLALAYRVIIFGCPHSAAPASDGRPLRTRWKER